MKKDIFIDATLASKFVSTKDPVILELYNWLDNNDAPDEDKAHLLISDFIRKEYFDVNNNCSRYNSICMLYARLQQQGRLHKKTKIEIADFKQINYSKKIWKNLSCKTNKRGEKSNDPEHIALIFLSDRKMALIEEDAFRNDLINFPVLGLQAVAANSADQLPYK